MANEVSKRLACDSIFDGDPFALNGKQMYVRGFRSVTAARSFANEMDGDTYNTAAGGYLVVWLAR